MRVLSREWFNVTRADTYRVIPLGDVHLGNAACDEGLFRSVVGRIAADDSCYWIGLGDYADFINVSDPRFDASELADWIKMADLGDLARAQRDRFLDIVRPIAPRCLALVEGNHEMAIAKHYERNIYSEIVTGVKEAGGFDADYQLGLGMYGWLLLHFYRSDRKVRGSLLKLNLHHGFVGGKLAGAKALNMQRWLWTRECDLALFGHSHNTGAQVESIEYVTKTGKVRHRRAIGAYCGTFLNGAKYAEVKGYFPAPVGHIEVLLKPGATDENDRVKVMSG
jgi:predicted phosphodiesterase